MPANTAAAPTIEYLVDTTCGRHMAWAATDMNDLFRQLQERGYVATRVQTMDEHDVEELKESA